MRWFNAAGDLMTDENWADSQCRTMMRLTDHLTADGSLDSMLVVIHGAEYEINVRLPEVSGVGSYQLLWDSSQESPGEARDLLPGASLEMPGLSIALIRAC
jgi:glycogen operon protein